MTATAPAAATTAARPSVLDHLRRPPGKALHGSAAAGALLLLVSGSYPGGHFGLGVIGALIVAVCAVAWVLRLVSFAISAATHRSTGTWRTFLIAPIGGVVVLGILAADVPLRARWAVSLPSLDRTADRAIQTVADRSDPPSFGSISHPGRAGLYPLEEAIVDHDDVYLQVPGGGFFSTNGFARLPDGPPTTGRDTAHAGWTFDHLAGDWYAYRDNAD